MTFVPMEGLDRLNEDQLREYLINACNYLHIPPELGLVYYSWIDNGDVGRQRVLLLKRGAAEIIRNNLGVSITDSIQEPDKPDYVSWKAIGKIPSGRQEIAIGAKTTKNQFGKDIANASKAAHTESLIRLTLQFMGGGFLWEGEIDNQKIDTTQPSTTTIVSTPSVASPNSAAGVDITSAETEESHRRPRKGIVLDTPDVTVTSTVIASPEPVAVAPVAISALPTPEEVKEYRKRLAVYKNVILPEQGGMVPSENIGGVDSKVTLFFKKQIPGMTNAKELTKEQWNQVLGLMDKMVADEGAKSLVAFIEKTIGA